MNQKHSNSKFKSKWGFIMASVGSAVGMANVWGFPYKLGSYGGGAFLVAYIIFIIIFSYVGLSAEYAIGRRSRTGTLGSYENAWGTVKKGKIGRAIGWIPLIGSMCIAIGYAVIISYVLKALVSAITGSLMTVDTGVWFSSFSSAAYSMVPFHIIIVIVTLLTLVMGAQSIEKTNKILIPAFFTLFLILAVRVSFLPGAIEGYKFMFTPRWEELKNPMTWIWAMGQAFFSLSVTGSGMIVYGAYLPDDEDIVSSAKFTALFDTIAAIVAALVIIPACFAYNMDVGAGPGLLFVTLPKILQDIPFGRFFAVILFAAVVFAGITSLQNMFEAVGESLLHRFPKLNRKIVLAILCIICLGIGLHMHPISRWGPWMDIVSIYIIPIGATLGAITWFWVMKKDDLLNEVNKGAGKEYGNFWYSAGKFLYVPFAIILCCVALFMKVAF